MNDGLFEAHMLLYQWGKERLAKQAAEAGRVSDAQPATAAAPGSEAGNKPIVVLIGTKTNGEA